MYTEIVDFRPQSWKAASKQKPHRGLATTILAIIIKPADFFLIFDWIILSPFVRMISYFCLHHSVISRQSHSLTSVLIRISQLHFPQIILLPLVVSLNYYSIVRENVYLLSESLRFVGIISTSLWKRPLYLTHFSLLHLSKLFHYFSSEAENTPFFQSE